MNDAGLSTERMQAVAREFNLSETTFVERRAAAVEMGRPSEILLSAKVAPSRVRDVRVAGSTVVVATGRLFLA